MSETNTPDYSGMTLNERLFEAGLLEQFDQAVRDGNQELMADLLARVQAREIKQITDQILRNPTRYGRI